jgi:hypothetical protein
VFVFLGVLPWILVPRIFGEPNARWGVVLLPSGRDLLLGAAVAAIAVSTILLNPGRSKFTKKYPQMRIRRWRKMEITVNLVTWVLYLAAYETMFRGYLLFSLDGLGMIPALAVVQTLYIIIHLPFGGTVTWGTIPFGIAVGLITWQGNSFWAAYLAHIAVAFTHSIQSAVLNPEMDFPFPARRKSNAGLASGSGG